MSAPVTPRMSPAVLLGFIESRERRALAQHTEGLPVRRRDPYTVERYPAVNNAVHLVGYDGRGEVMIELRMPARRVSERTVERLRRWMEQNDDVMTLSLVES